MTQLVQHIHRALAIEPDRFEVTADGTRVPTQCRYPSFDIVHVYVVKHGDGFIVHDGGEAAACAWAHGRDFAAIGSTFQRAAARFDCEYVAGSHMLRAVAETMDWLRSALLAVANAASLAATTAVTKIATAKVAKIEQRVESVLRHVSWAPDFKKDEPFVGRSGKSYEFAFVIHSTNRTTLIDTVVAHPHSVAAKYRAFSDTDERSKRLGKFLVHSRLAREDRLLLMNVADLISIRDLEKSDARALLH